ncbi:MAG: histidine kinase [Verrucomicrobiales bacterium]|nr:histidine kinase [Verrucomicrobiales bacterium]
MSFSFTKGATSPLQGASFDSNEVLLTRLEQLKTVGNRTNVPVRFQSTVIFVDRGSAILGDASGIATILANLEGQTLVCGNEVIVEARASRKTGKITSANNGGWLDPRPTLENLRVITLGQVTLPEPRHVHPGEPLTERENGVWSELEGRVTFCSFERGVSILELTRTNASVRVHVPTAERRLDALLGASLRVKGFCGAVSDPRGRQVLAMLWARNSDDIQLIDPLDEPNGRFPLLIEQLVTKEGSTLSGKAVRFRGRTISSDAGHIILDDGRVQPGGPRIRVNLFKGQSATKPGQWVEVVGILKWRRNNPLIDEAFYRSSDKPGLNRAKTAILNVATNVAAFRNLSREDISAQAPVKLRGVVILRTRWGSFGLQEETGTVWIYPEPDMPLPVVQLGDIVDVEGHAFKGGFTSVVLSRSCKILGQGRILEPLSATWDYLMSGKADSQWLEIRGVVRTAEPAVFEMHLPSGRIRIEMMQSLPQETATKLIGATIRVRGMGAGIISDAFQMAGMTLFVESEQFISVEAGAATEPFDLPSQPVEQAKKFKVQDHMQDHLPNLVKIEGIVTFSQGTTIFLEDSTDAIRVETKTAGASAPGDRLEAVGFIEHRDFSPALIGAFVRKTGGGALPTPLRIDSNQLPRLAHDTKRLTLRATVIEQKRSASGKVLQLQSGNRLFQAMVTGDEEATGSREVSSGSRVEVTGVCRLLMDGRAVSLGMEPSFELLVAHSADIVVVERPPWWTSKRALWALGGSSSALAIAAAWIAMVSRKNVTLGRVQRELQKAHDELEQRVVDRTADLNKANSELLGKTREAEQAREIAEAGTLAKSQFLANMSHELRTPLNGIIGFTEFLSDEKPGKLNPRQKEYLGDVLSSGRHLLQLINDVLDLAKVEAGKMELHPSTFVLAKAIEEVCAVAKPIVQKKRIQLKTNTTPKLGEVTLDESKFKQVLYNLLSNAVKFTDDDGIVEIDVNITGKDQFQLSVKDTGIGIRAEDIKRLFTEFEQLESGTARRFEGTGLGLALTRKIVELHSGTMHVDSEFGKGSTFIVILPIGIVV